MIGIFQHKKAEYNKMILQALIYGEKNTQQLGEYIYKNKSAVPFQKTNKNEVKKIVSTISRHTDKQEGRLCELEKKGYILREEGQWRLTRKGVCVALTLFSSVQEIFPYIRVDIAGEMVENDFMGNRQFRRLVTKHLSKTKVKNVFEVGKSTDILQLWKDYTNELINMGVDLDKINEEQFTSLLTTKCLEHFFKPDLTKLNRNLKEYVDKRTNR